ncbi:MAG: hypothetical protein GXP31_10700 [Kiritimatiellaeota bacterium]|nr:hypothetical protein [Kiritimatiellota bacterium]
MQKRIDNDHDYENDHNERQPAGPADGASPPLIGTMESMRNAIISAPGRVWDRFESAPQSTFSHRFN